MRSVAPLAVLAVGAVPAGNLNIDPKETVRLPVPSCVVQIDPPCPGEAAIDDGLEIVKFPVRVLILKLLASLNERTIADA